MVKGLASWMVKGLASWMAPRARGQRPGSWGVASLNVYTHALVIMSNTWPHSQHLPGEM